MHRCCQCHLPNSVEFIDTEQRSDGRTDGRKTISQFHAYYVGTGNKLNYHYRFYFQLFCFILFRCRFRAVDYVGFRAPLK